MEYRLRSFGNLPLMDTEPLPTPTEPIAAPLAAIDLDAIERDLADVDIALARLDAGTYWTDEVTGGALPAELLADHPTARRIAAQTPHV